MKFVKLTRNSDNKDIYVRADNIQAVYIDDCDSTKIAFIGEQLTVGITQSVEEAVALIEEVLAE